MRMENSIVPTAAARGIFRIFANHVQHRLHDAEAQGFVILRHDNHVTALLGADLVDKLTKSFGAREIEGSTWLASVPVSTRDQQSPPATSQLNDAVVLNRATGSVDFKTMQEGHITTQKLIEDFSVSLRTHATQVPKGMIEDDE